MKKKERIKGKEEELGKCQTKEAEERIKDAAKILQHQNLLLKIGDENFIAMVVCYMLPIVPSDCIISRE